MEILQQLKNVYATLNQIEIKGDLNIAYMYGSLSALKETINQLENVERDDSNGQI